MIHYSLIRRRSNTSHWVTTSLHRRGLGTVMKIRWFAWQNATYFRVLANQFDICAHSGANHYTPCTRERQRHIYQFGLYSCTVATLHVSTEQFVTVNMETLYSSYRSVYPRIIDCFLSFDFFQPPMLSLSVASALCYKWKLTGEINLELSDSSTCCE